MNVVYATGSAMITTPDGGRHLVQGGQHWPADDPVVLAAPGHFAPDPRFGLSFSVPPAEMSEPPVETVTSGPGEKRSAVRRHG